jgi:hypothetical protein
MSCPFAFRVCLLACLLVPAVALFSLAFPAKAQAQRVTYERSWRCARCGGYLGNSVSRPTYCHHCDGKRQSSSGSKSSKEGSSVTTMVFIGGAVLVAVAVGLLLMSSSSTKRYPPRNQLG